MASGRATLWLILCSVAVACGGPRSESQAAMTAGQRAAVADTVGSLTRELLESGETLDVDRMMSWFRDGSGSAFGGAAGMVLSTAEFRSNLRLAYGGLSGQEIQPLTQRVVVLAPDAAVVTGLGQFVSTDTIGNRAYGDQGYTFVWTRADGEWRAVQAHFSSNLRSVEPATPQEAPR